jgi:hypothetical protein
MDVGPDMDGYLLERYGGMMILINCPGEFRCHSLTAALAAAFCVRDFMYDASTSIVRFDWQGFVYTSSDGDMSIDPCIE